MNSLTLFTLRTLVGIFLTLGMGSLAHGQAPGLSPQSLCTAATNFNNQGSFQKCREIESGTGGGCETTHNKVKEAFNKFSLSCSKAKLGTAAQCMKKASECQEKAEDADIGDAGFGVLGSLFASDTEFVKKCPMTVGKDNQTNIKDITRELKDAQKQARELEKKMIEDAKKAKQDMADIMTKLSELDQKKVTDEAELSKRQAEEKAQATAAMNEANNSLQELNTAILNAQTKRAQTEAKKAQELEMLSKAMIESSCNEKIKALGRKSAGSASGIIRARGVQKENFQACVRAALARRKEIIISYEGAVKGLDDEITKNMSRIDQVQANLKQMEQAAAQAAANAQKEGEQALAKYYSDRQNLTQQYLDVSQAAQAAQQQANQELAELKAEVTKQSNRLALAEQQPVNNTETTDDAMAGASAYNTELTTFKNSECCKGSSTFEACKWKQYKSSSGAAGTPDGTK